MLLSVLELQYIQLGPIFDYNDLNISIWSNKEVKNSLIFKKYIPFFYVDISNVPRLLNKLSKLTLFLWSILYAQFVNLPYSSPIMIGSLGLIIDHCNIHIRISPTYATFKFDNYTLELKKSKPTLSLFSKKIAHMFINIYDLPSLISKLNSLKAFQWSVPFVLSLCIFPIIKMKHNIVATKITL